MMIDSPKDSFLDAMPDLVIGLVGIPVAFSVQNIAQTVLQSNFTLRSLSAGLGYFSLVIVIFGLASIGLLMVVETDSEIAKTEKEWQYRLVRRLAAVTVPMVLFVFCVIALGITYAEPIHTRSDFVNSILQPRGLMSASIFGSIWIALWTVRPNSPVTARFPFIHPYFTSVQFGMLIIAVALLLKL